MKKILIFLYSMFSLLCFSQSRFVYEYNYKPEKNKDSLVTDICYLDTDDSGSFFYSASKKKVDSLVEFIRDNKEAKPVFPKYNSNLMYSITKNYKNKERVYHINFSGYKFKISENDSFKWNVMKETKTIGKYKCQKAVASFKGREWIAWFSTELPISDGPYKFSGLPGMILEIEDQDKDHSFKLVEIKSFKGGMIPTFTNEKEIKKEQLDKLLDERGENINENISGMYINGNVMSFLLKDGNLLQIEKGKKNIEKELEKQVRRSNNPIELN